MKTDALHRPVCDLLGCEYPVVLAGMGGVARSELVLAVTRGGGFGFLGMVREPCALIRQEVAFLRAHTDRDFGVNLIPASTDPALLDEQIATCIELDVPVVCLFWDLAAEVVGRLREAGIIVVCQVGSVEEALSAEAAGAHALIAQGREAGGHVRGRQPLATLLPEIAAASRLPVLAAGGLSSGVDLANMLALGAQGVVMGTAFLATQESFAHDYHKQRIVEAGVDDTVLTDAFHINWPPGAPVRVLANSVTRGDWGDPHTDTRTVIGDEAGRPIYVFSTDSPLRNMHGNFEAMALYAGQAAGKIREIVSAGDRLQAIVSEAASLLPAAPRPRRKTHDTLSSPVCWAGEGDDVYMGFPSRDTVLSFLNNLLELEQDCTRVIIRLALEVPDVRLREIALAIHTDKAVSCQQLSAAIRRLGDTPSSRPSGLYERVRLIKDPTERLLRFNRKQVLITRHLREMLPLVRDEELFDCLQELLTRHEDNIGRLEVQVPLGKRWLWTLGLARDHD